MKRHIHHIIIQKQLYKFYYPVLLAMFLLCCTKTQDALTPAPPRQGYDSIYNGVNLQPSYYNGGNPDFAWNLMKQQPKIRTVRIEIEPDKVTQAKSWIAQAKTNGYTVIATYHKFTALGSDDPAELLLAADWWKNNYVALGGNFTINLMNEWGSHNLSASAYASAYNQAISVVRTVYNGSIIIDIPGWGQATHTAYEACITAGTVLSDTNIILSAHIYPNGWNQAKNRHIRPSDLDDITKAGKRGIIGEFGSGHTGPADWSAIVDHARSKGWPVLGWCWNGDGGSMNMVSPSWAINPAATSFSLSAYFAVVYNKL